MPDPSTCRAFLLRGVLSVLLLPVALMVAGAPAWATPVRWDFRGVITDSSTFDFVGLSFTGTVVFDPDLAPAVVDAGEAIWSFPVPPFLLEFRVGGQRFAMEPGRSLQAFVANDAVPSGLPPGDPRAVPRDAISFTSIEDGVATFPYFRFGLRGEDLTLLDATEIPSIPPDLSEVELAGILYGEGFGPDGASSFAGDVTWLRAAALPEPRLLLLLLLLAAVGGVRGRARASRASPGLSAAPGPR